MTAAHNPNMVSRRTSRRVSTETSTGSPLAWMKAIDFPEWMAEAACSVSDATWFPTASAGVGHDRRLAAASAEAKAVCAVCPVREQCLTYAFETDQKHGVWGGLNELERRELKRRPPRAS